MYAVRLMSAFDEDATPMGLGCDFEMDFYEYLTPMGFVRAKAGRRGYRQPHAEAWG